MPKRLADAGWIWEGQYLDPDFPPSIFGVTQGAAYFGLRKTIWMYEPNSEFAMEQMRRLDEVVLHMIPYPFLHPEVTLPDGSRTRASCMYWNNTAAALAEESRTIARLSRTHPNISGGLHDDMLGGLRDEKITPSQYATVHDALKENPKLKLWGIVYTHELDASAWAPFIPFIDVVNLWNWRAKDLVNLDRDITRCREIFPGKPVNLGCYLRDYPESRAMPMDLLKQQWEHIPKYLADGKITGFSILGAYLIDQHPEQASWVRNFIRAN
jgi:hypothetical protein